MGQEGSKFSDSEKLNIKKAIWSTFTVRSLLSTPDNYEEELFQRIKHNFLLHECVRNKLVGPYTPDILIRSVGVIEVKCIRWSNLNSGTRNKIETYMKGFSLPGLLVNFPPNGENPYLRWYYLDENKETILEECETINSDPSESSSSQQNQQSSSGLAAALGIVGAGAVIAIGAALGYASSQEEKSDRSKNPGEEASNTTRSSSFSSFDYAIAEVRTKESKRKKKQKTFDEVLEIIEEAASETKSKVEPNQDARYGDNRHNQYLNAFCRILDDKLHRQGFPFEKEKIFYYDGGKHLIPDIYINNIAVVEVKTKASGLQQDDIIQMKNYNKIIKHPAVSVNFGTQLVRPHVRVFKDEY